MKEQLSDRVALTAKHLAPRLRSFLPGAPAAVLSSRFGLDFLEESVVERWPATRIPGLSTVPGLGQGMLCLCEIEGTFVLCHEWEEYPGESVTEQEEAYLVWVAAQLQVPRLVVLAAGTSLHGSVAGGCVAVVRDHVRWDRSDPLTHWPVAPPGSRYPQMQDLYEPSLRRAALRALAENGASECEVVALIRRGPCGATDAEARAFRSLGADVMLEGGCSETLAARHSGLEAVLLSPILRGFEDPVDAPSILAHADAAAAQLPAVISRIVQSQTEGDVTQ